MQNAFKQFGARGTGWFKNLFQLSLWRLTVFYTVILGLILFISSSFIYGAFSKRLENRFRITRMPLTQEIIRISPPQPTADDVRTDLVNSLFIVNGLLLVIAALLSYFLAQATIEPLQAMDEKQKRFFGDASHELRTPLSILKIDLENELENNTNDTTEKTRLMSYLEEVNRMSRLVNNLLTLSRFDEHDMSEDRQFSQVNLTQLIDATVHHLLTLANHYGVTLTITPTHETIVLTSNEDILSQILTNVIKNGILYNKPNGTVTIAAHTTNKQAVVTITDTGMGMTKDEIKKIFDRFYRADKSRSSKTKGSGLGLSIVHSSIQYLDGAIEVDSIPEQGTTITLTLPI